MDPLTLITLAKTAANFVPTIAGWFGGDDAQEAATTVVDVAKQVTGLDDPQDAMSTIQSDPQLQIQFQQAMNPVIIARLENETKQLAEVNATMRAELSSDSKFKSWWRPGFGWSLLISWTLTVLGLLFIIGWVVIKSPGDLGEILSGLSQVLGPLSIMWGIALSILGININKRSQDKAMMTGQAPPLGILGALAKRLGG